MQLPELLKKNYTEFEDLKERVVTFAVKCSEKLRQQKSCCNAIMLFVNSNRHRKELPQYNRATIIKLPYATNSSIELAKFAVQALKIVYKEGIAYKKTGVVVLDLIPEDKKQIQLFENSNPKHVALMKTVDRINNTFGTHKIKLASQDLKRVWKMKQEKLSPNYTTSLVDIITINC